METKYFIKITKTKFPSIKKGDKVLISEKLEANIPVILFKDKNLFIMKCPILPIIVFGKNEEEIKTEWDLVAKEFFRLVLQDHKILSAQAKIFGWNKIKNKNEMNFDSLGKLGLKLSNADNYSATIY